MKKWWFAFVFLLASFSLAAAVHFYSIKKAIGQPVVQLADQLTKGYGIMQIIAILILFTYGFLLLRAMKKTLSNYWVIVLAFPVALASWCVCSLILLILGIPFHLLSTAIFMLLILIIIWIQEKRIWNRQIILDGLYYLIYGTGIAAIATSGIFPIIMSGDSYYFIMQYGYLLAKAGRISLELVGQWVTWTGHTPALIGSIAYFGGFETIWGIHHMLMISFVSTVALFLYENLKHRFKKKALWISCFLTAFIFYLPPVRFLSAYVIANAYFMVYMFLLFCLSLKVEQAVTEEQKFYGLLISLFSIMLSMSRPEGGATVCFLILCLSCLKLANGFLIKYLMIPNGVVLLGFYLKLWSLGSFHADEWAMLDYKTVAIILAIWTILFLYLCFIRNKRLLKLQNHVEMNIFIALSAGSLLLMLIDTEKYIGNLQVILYNLANETWGYVPWFLLLGSILLVKKGVSFTFKELFWLGFILFNIDICWGRDHMLRIGTGDSCNRILFSVVPVIICSMVISLMEVKCEKN